MIEITGDRPQHGGRPSWLWVAIAIAVVGVFASMAFQGAARVREAAARAD